MDKCELTRHTVRFLGHVISADGVKPDPEKTRAVQGWTHPKMSVNSGVFWAMVNQLGRFLPNLAEKDQSAKRPAVQEEPLVLGDRAAGCL